MWRNDTSSVALSQVAFCKKCFELTIEDIRMGSVIWHDCCSVSTSKNVFHARLCDLSTGLVQLDSNVQDFWRLCSRFKKISARVMFSHLGSYNGGCYRLSIHFQRHCWQHKNGKFSLTKTMTYQITVPIFVLVRTTMRFYWKFLKRNLSPAQSFSSFMEMMMSILFLRTIMGTATYAATSISFTLKTRFQIQ